MGTPLGQRRVLLLEFNEITRTIIDPMLSRGKLPTFARLFSEGAVAAPLSVDAPPNLDPWVTWVTLHTGVDCSVHGATVLEQDVATIRAKRTWDYAVEAGKTIGVFGSISAHPPRPVPGFMVPGPFAPSNDTYPRYLAPVQLLNRKYTQIHHKNSGGDGPFDMARQALSLLSLGLSPVTAARISFELAREKTRPGQKWRRISLQPLINLDFFRMLYRRYRPDYATWHTNHAAHYMHHYWRAFDDTGFLAPATPEEKKDYGGAVELGYEICDELLARFLDLVDDDTVIVLATSMGQKPYVAELFPEGRIVLRFRDVHGLLAILAARGVTEVVPTMVPQYNVRIPDAAERARVGGLLRRARAVHATYPGVFTVVETGDVLTVTPAGLAKKRDDIRYFLDGAPNAKKDGYTLDELFVADAPTPKQGMHDPTGLLVLHGKGIRRGVEIKGTSNLDIAPTLLTLLGTPVPATMKGRVLDEAWRQ
ncbi:MAG TPA: hypothetical protein VM686_26725 [Polyangiaceae bacterium]|nr:hypothetical protein [Polyangiaceae bacterium]